MTTCGPEHCPLEAWTNYSPSERAKRRDEIILRLDAQGFTQQSIAAQLGISQNTVSLALGKLSKIDKSKPTKSATNPKGAGRPRSSREASRQRRKNTSETARRAAASIVDGEQTYRQAEQNTGLSNVALRSAVAREEGRREPHVERADLSLTAQQKLDSVIKREMERLRREFNRAVHLEVKRITEEITIPEIRQKLENAQKVLSRRRGVMTKATFNKIRRVLHPDSRKAVSDKIMAEAFDEFMALEVLLLNEEASPMAGPSTLPETWADWEKAKAAATAERRARRATNGAMVRRA